jgi:hypothetical protein
MLTGIIKQFIDIKALHQLGIKIKSSFMLMGLNILKLLPMQ